ncbi:MAG: TIR domain-containing protein [Dehalococcoidia bacterium]
MLIRDWPLLFQKYDLRAVLEAQLASVGDKVRGISKGDFDRRSDEYLAATVASQLVVSRIELLEDEVSVTPKDTKVDVSHDPNRHFFEPGPHYIDGVEVTYHVPYGGDRELFQCAPSRFTTVIPRAIVDQEELRFPIDAAGSDVAKTKETFERSLSEVQRWVAWVNEQVDEYNQKLEPAVHAAVVRRREEIGQTAAAIQDLGFPIRTDSSTKPAEKVSNPAAVAVRRERKREKARRTYDVALSFAGEDREYVESVAECLTGLGITVFYDRYEEAQLWGEELAEHLGKVYSEDSHFVVLFASRHYAHKAWPSHERQHALGRRLSGESGRILPARLDDTEIPGLPPTIGYIDARVVSPAKLAELVRQKVDSL